MTANDTAPRYITIAIDEIDDLPDELVDNPPPPTRRTLTQSWQSWRHYIAHPLLLAFFRDVINRALIPTLAAAATVDLARHTVQLAATMNAAETHADPNHSVIRAAASVALSARALLTALTHTNAPATLLIIAVVAGLIRSVVAGRFGAAAAICSTARVIMPVFFPLALFATSAGLHLPMPVAAAPFVAYIAYVVINAWRVKRYGIDAVLTPWAGMR
jgi:hypothetical protein